MMRSRLFQFILFGALVLLVIQIVLIAPRQIRDESQQETRKTTAPEAPTGGDSLDQKMRGMHMVETREGAKEWELWSEDANTTRVRDISELFQVKALFFSDSGATFTVTGNKGTVEAKTKNMHLNGDVVTRSSNGYVFKTTSLDYNSTTRELTTDAAVEMLGPRDASGHSLRLTGVGMKALMNEASMEVLHEVKAEKTMDNSKKAYIKSNRSLFSGKHKMAKFSGDVILDMDNMRITGPEAQFEYDPKKDSMKSVVFTGGAKVSDAEKFATAQNLRVDFETNKFVFRGSPRVVQNNDELRGEEIVFLEGGKRVQVLRARAKVDEKRMEKVN
jgi:LPS export ABC transporter protein LptC/lipopolysaccharide transport protein LptA